MMMQQIAVGGLHHAVVDDNDYALACTRVWTPKVGPHTTYARSNTCHAGAYVLLHRLIAAQMGLDGGIDHKNGDGLDCRRENLRVATKSQNAANLRHLYGSNRSGYRGVAPSGSTSSPWRARIRVNGREHWLGHYGTLEEAVRAYNAAALEAWGEFAYLNTLEDG